MLQRLIVMSLLLAGCATAIKADAARETYSVYIYWSRSNFASVTYTDPNGFIDLTSAIPCSELSSFHFTIGFRPSPCYTGLIFTPEEGGMSVFISSRTGSLAGGFFLTPDEDGRFIISPTLPSFLMVSAPPAARHSAFLSSDTPTVVTPEPSLFIPMLISVLALLARKMMAGPEGQTGRFPIFLSPAIESIPFERSTYELLTHIDKETLPS